jgi:radical SAM superfamily enzyme YgiQ (UPF0313 family)
LDRPISGYKQKQNPMIMPKICFVAIAGTNQDTLLSVQMLKAYLMQFNEIRDNYEIKILNFFMSATTKEIARKINLNKPDIICFSSYVWNSDRVNELTIAFRSLNKEIIIGGPEVSNTRNIPGIEWISGAGEQPLYEILTGKKPPKQEYCDYPISYPENKQIRASFETQRGCNYCCAYCNYNKGIRRIQYRNPFMVAREILYCWQNGIKEGRIVDPNFFSNNSHVWSIMRSLTIMNVKMRLFFEAIPKYVDWKTVHCCFDYINNGGQLVISLGIQSLNRESLKAVNRPSGNEDHAIDLLTNMGAELRLDGILGLPFETKSSYEKLINYICSKLVLGNHYPNLNVLMIIKGTKLYSEYQKLGLKLRNDLVYETPTMTENEMIDCIRMNAIVISIFRQPSVREIYLGMQIKNHTDKIKSIAKYLLNVMPSDSQFVNPIDQEFYYKEMIPAELILEALK